MQESKLKVLLFGRNLSRPIYYYDFTAKIPTCSVYEHASYYFSGSVLHCVKSIRIRSYSQSSLEIFFEMSVRTGDLDIYILTQKLSYIQGSY